MARVIQTDNRYFRGANGRVRVIGIGLFVGILSLGLAWILGRFVVDPLLCRSWALDSCVDSSVIAFNIASVLGAVFGASVLIRIRVYRAVLITLSTLVSFWGLIDLTDGLHWLEVCAWVASLTGVSYLLFFHISRVRSIFVAVIMAIAVILVIRWFAFL